MKVGSQVKMSMSMSVWFLKLMSLFKIGTRNESQFQGQPGSVFAECSSRFLVPSPQNVKILIHR